MSFAGAPPPPGVTAATTTPPKPYFCYQCHRAVSITISPSDDPFCPICHDSFIEELESQNSQNPNPFSESVLNDPFDPFSSLFPPLFQISGNFSHPEFQIRPELSDPNAFNPFDFLRSHLQNLHSGGARVQFVIENNGVLNNKYGPLLYLRLATYPAVLVSSAPVATEIFKAQDVHFASRIKSPFEDNLLFGSSTSFFNAPYGDYWKFMKKICMTELLGSSQMKKLKNVRHEEVVRFLSKMSEIGQKNDVADLSAEVLTLANNATCRMIMSARCSGEDNQADQCRGLVSESFDLAAKLAVCNLFGPLKRIGIWFLRKKIAAVPKRYDELFENILVEHEEKAKRGGPHMENKDLMDILLEVYHDKNAEMRITRKQMKTFFLDLFTGGTSTTADAILWILGELVNHPASFKKLREEIDSVVGTERLADEADIPNLPYFQACVKEAMRLHPPVPLFDRVCREDCKLAGHDIPKGITMIMNAYSIMRDPKIWDNPNDFIPERFLTEHDSTKGQNLQIYVPFGGGRRMCPGTNMSSSLINCSVSAMVQCFDWKVVGGDGLDGSKVNMDTKAGVTMSLEKPFMSTPVLHRNLFSA